ncbi:hypothetical protein CEE39_01510 [bacterium (candidate division B38) B3_B38]|nr:MAG: hypothetical protein CEE39_01510 [bacterium (candidate division B38) B3_B38]
MPRSYELLAEKQVVGIFADFLKESLMEHRFEERLHVAPSEGPEVWEYIRGEEIISLCLDDSVGSQTETQLILESETDIADFYAIITKAIVSFHSGCIKRMLCSIPDDAERRKIMDQLK